MFQKEVLPNGVRIVTEEMPQVRSISIGLWVNVGSRDEDEQNNGITHFIEHLMFKGTKKRTARQIAEELDSVGGQLNAFTAKEYTCYYAKVLDNHIDIAIDVLTDMFFNSLFDEGELNKERNVVIEEIKMYDDAPDELVHDLFASAIWPGHPLGRPIIGYENIINRLTRQDIVDYFHKYYTPDNLVISVAGNIKHRDIVNKLSPLFANFRGTGPNKTHSKPIAQKASQTKFKEIEQVHLCLGTEGVPVFHEDYYSLNLLNGAIGGGVSSRLFQNIREQRGMAYSVYSYQTSYQKAGLFNIYGGLNKKNIDQFLKLVIAEMKSIARQGITENEINMSREHLKGSMYLGLESASSRMSRNGKWEVTQGSILTPEEVVEKIDQITLEQIKVFAEKLLIPETYTVTMVGPLEKEIRLEDYLA